MYNEGRAFNLLYVIDIAEPVTDQEGEEFTCLLLNNISDWGERRH